MPSNSCMGCTERYVGCHSKCEKYQNWLKIYHEQIKVQKKKDREYRDYFYK